MARPTLWSEELETEAWQYITDYEGHGHAFPSVVGLCAVIERSKSSVYEWAQDESKGFSDILEAIKEAQELVAWNKGLNGDYNASLVKLLLGKHGYSDKVESELSGPNGGPIPVNAWAINPVSAKPSGKDTD